MSNVRLRRLQADYESLQRYVTRHPRLQLIQAQGNPPEKYQIEYRINSLRQKEDQLQEVNSHLVEISLPRDYPRLPPLCRMLTPVFHPNIAPHAICIGDHWSAGESLVALVARIGEILAYQSYNTKSPLNGEAARWTDQNLARLPLDKVSMTIEEQGASAAPVVARPAAVSPPPPPAPPRMAASAPVASAVAAPPPPPPRSTAAPAAPNAGPPTDSIVVPCPGCQAKLRLSRQIEGKRVRCPKCQHAFQVPALQT